MSIATELQALNDNILDAYTAVQGKGGTVPANKNTANLDMAIASIPAGPEAYIPLEVTGQGVLQRPSTSFTWSAPNTATSIGENGLFYSFYDYPTLLSVDLSNITTVGAYGLYYAFFSCTSLASIDLSSVTTIGDRGLYYAFSHCTSLTSIDLSSVTNIGQYGLQDAFDQSGLVSADLRNVTSVAACGLYSTFNLCRRLTSVNLTSLTNINANQALYRAFRGCTSLTTISFPALTTSSFGSYTNQFNDMLNSCSNVTVHFPSAIQSTIGNWSSVTSGFGGTNTTVLFDL